MKKSTRSNKKRAARTSVLGIFAAASLVASCSIPMPPTTSPNEIDASKVQVPDVQSLPASASRGCMVPAAKVSVSDNSPQQVDDPPYANFTVGQLDENLWRNPPTPNAQWKMFWLSMRWAQSYGQAAYNAGAKNTLTNIVSQVSRFYEANSDPGNNQSGWDEGTSLRRLETLNCLYSLSHDDRIPDLMSKEVAVQQSNRYYGPPYKFVHNHGTMANNKIIIAGILTNNKDWIAFAASRLLSESHLAFSDNGVNLEQSSSYHGVNVNVWKTSLVTLKAVFPNEQKVKDLENILAKADSFTQWLTEPDGKLVQIGDSSKTTGKLWKNGPATGGTFRDDASGYAIGRWSWTNPDTTYFTLRYGGPIRAHGHNDKSSLTWSTGGSRILVGPGYAQSDPTYWHKTPAAQNTDTVDGCATAPTTSTLKEFSKSGSVANATLNDSSCGANHLRKIVVNDSNRSLVVEDSFDGPRAHTQHFHLDPSWTQLPATSNNVISFRNAHLKKTLTLTTSGTVGRVLFGTEGAPQGWQYESPTERKPAADIEIHDSSGKLITTFQLS